MTSRAFAIGASASGGGFADGFYYVLGRPDLKGILSMLFLVGTFGLNFPIVILTMSVSVFKSVPANLDC